MLFSTQAYCDSIKSIKCGWLSISDSTQKMIVQEYVNALESFAQAMPIVGGDTGSSWAADMPAIGTGEWQVICACESSFLAVPL